MISYFLIKVFKTEEEGAMTEPGHHSLSHPLQVHVTGKDRQVGVTYLVWCSGGLTVRYKNINQQLNITDNHCTDNF